MGVPWWGRGMSKFSASGETLTPIPLVGKALVGGGRGVYFTLTNYAFNPQSCF